MMVREDYVATLLGDLHKTAAKNDNSKVFMPSNIALIKYWGKRQPELNLPLVSSLSVTMQGYGTKTLMSMDLEDRITMNGVHLRPDDLAFQKVVQFLNLFRAPGEFYAVETENNIPTASGVASSASGFAALLAALIQLKGWDVPLKTQSMLARLGSGSAARSFWPGMVLWNKGESDDGLDCYAEPYTHAVEDICLAVLVLDQGEKEMSSRAAMEHSLMTSCLAQSWPAVQERHLFAALAAKDFEALGEIAEENAVFMHRLLAESSPPVIFGNRLTWHWKKQVAEWREEGLPIYYTQDAGAQLKILFPASYRKEIEARLEKSALDYFTVAV